MHAQAHSQGTLETPVAEPRRSRRGSSIRRHGDRRLVVALLAASCVAVVAAYASGLQDRPVAEDFVQPQAFLRIGDNSQFRPVFAILMLALQALFGPPFVTPVPYHVFSLAIHIVTTLVLFLLAREFVSSDYDAVAIAFIFGLYPRHHESVFWPAASLHSVMTLLVLLSLLLYITKRNDEGLRSVGAATVLFALGLLSSEAAGAALALFVAFELLRLEPYRNSAFYRELRSGLIRLVPFFVVVLSYLAVLAFGSRHMSRLFGSHSDMTFYHLSLSLSEIRDFGGYLAYTLYAFVPLRELGLESIKVLMLVSATIAVVVGLLRGTRLVRFGIIWTMVTFLPYVLLVPFGNADRYFYLPSVGFCLAIVGAFRMLRESVGSHYQRSGSKLAMLGGLAGLAIYGMSAFGYLNARAVEWRAAGESVNRLLVQVYTDHPTIDRATAFFFVGLPGTYGQARFLGFGIQPALRDHYNDPDLVVGTTSTSAIVNAVEQGHPLSGRQQLDQTYIYLYRDQSLQDVSSSVADPLVRNAVNNLRSANP